MRLISFLISLGSFALASARAQEAPSAPLNVMSFNLRMNTAFDLRNAWPNRKEMAAAVFKERRIDLAGLQEALVGQIADLQRLLPEYAWIGVGREDGQDKGEFAPIFYRRARLTLEKQGTFWLSESPEEAGSRGWDAALPRVATWGIFREASSGKRFFAINTHFDHRGEEARRQSARLLLQRIQTLREGLPAVLTGDFNTTPGSPPIQAITGGAELKLTDARNLTQTPHAGGESTFNGFRPEASGEIIDFIFVGPGIQVKSHGYFPSIKDGVFVSDHWPVASQIVLP